MDRVNRRLQPPLGARQAQTRNHQIRACAAQCQRDAHAQRPGEQEHRAADQNGQGNDGDIEKVSHGAAKGSRSDKGGGA
jgi:hypothetical protein